jgi:hypothetical protein
MATPSYGSAGGMTLEWIGGSLARTSAGFGVGRG